MENRRQGTTRKAWLGIAALTILVAPAIIRHPLPTLGTFVVVAFVMGAVGVAVPPSKRRTYQVWLGSVIFAILIAPAVIRDPLTALGAFVGVGIAIVAVSVTVRAFRRHAVSRVSARFTESPSTPIRIATKAVTGYATYVVGFWTVVAVVLLFQVIGHFL
jgi:hypothetical protein